MPDINDKKWIIGGILLLIIIFAILYGVLNFHVDANGVAATIDKSNIPDVNLPKIG